MEAKVQILRSRSNIHLTRPHRAHVTYPATTCIYLAEAQENMVRSRMSWRTAFLL